MTDQNQQAQLPPLDKASELLVYRNGYYTFDSVEKFRAEAERQLLQALRERDEVVYTLHEYEAALAAANRRAEEVEKREQEMRGKLEEIEKLIYNAVNNRYWPDASKALIIFNDVFAAIPAQPEQTQKEQGE